MSLPAIEQLLKDTMGLNSASIGSSAIARAVQQRMRELSIASADDYLLRVRTSPAETTRLIDLVVIPETWFFRDRNPFVALSAFARERWPVKGRSGPLRVLSVPCSTGEEPYTIVMALLDAGLTPRDFVVDAVDISEPNLERARSGVYRDNSFRGDDLKFRDRYFTETAQGFLLKPEVRDQVSFQQANLLAPGFLAHAEPYDVLFCRNLLIYFDRTTQAQALRILERLLHPAGLLFLGHAEAGVLAGRRFTPLDHARSFAFIRGTGHRPPKAESPEPFQFPGRRRAAATRPAATAELRRPFAGAQAAPTESPVRAGPPDLANAASLANAGHLVEAARICEVYLEQCGPDAQAFYLLALMRAAAGEPAEAEALLRKAVYLEPGHYEALTSLATLVEQRGDHAGSALLRQRAQRSFERLQHEAAHSAEAK